METATTNCYITQAFTRLKTKANLFLYGFGVKNLFTSATSQQL